MSTWRQEKKERTRDAIAGAALRRFVEDGYDAVTVADVARAAGVGERTVYRYFVDKEELLFADDARVQDALAVAITAQHPDADPLTAMRAAAQTIADVFDDRPEQVRRRTALIATTPALSARERVKQAGWQARLTEVLVDRGIPAPRARLYGAIGVACFVEALTRWLARDGTRIMRPGKPDGLRTEIDRALADVAALAAGPGHTPTESPDIDDRTRVPDSASGRARLKRDPGGRHRPAEPHAAEPASDPRRGSARRT